MSDFNRRRFLTGLLSTLAQAAGAVVVASSAVSTAQARGQSSEGAEAPAQGVQERADRLAASGKLPSEADTEPIAFLNGAFRNTPLGSFRNTPLRGFRNTPLGNFRNTPLGAFRNTPLGSFANGGWPNGGWGGFNNGGWPNFGWRNWW
jgi:hypothetical protein